MTPEEFDALKPTEKAKLEFASFVKQLAMTLKAETESGLYPTMSLDLAKVLEDAITLRIEAYGRDYYYRGREDGRRSAESEFHHWMLKHHPDEIK